MRYRVLDARTRSPKTFATIDAPHGPAARKLVAERWPGKKLIVVEDVKRARCRTCGRFGELIDAAPEGESGDVVRCSFCDDPVVAAGARYLEKVNG